MTGNVCSMIFTNYRESANKQSIQQFENWKMKKTVYLEKCNGKSKMVYLTEKGKTYTSKTAARLFEAECKALSNWTEEEINLYLKLTERYHADLKNEIESL